MLVAELCAALVVAVHQQAEQPAPVVTTSSDSIEHRFAVGTTPDRIVRSTNEGGPDAGRLLSRVAADMRPAVEAVVAFWGPDWSPEIPVIATGTDEQFRVAAGGGPAAQWTDIAAVTVVDRVDPALRTALGARIVFAPGAAGMSVGALRIVLTHELFHFAARADTATDAPRWLAEGVADYVARPPTAVPADAATTLPTDSELDATGPQRSQVYDRAWWFARFVADIYGVPKLRELYRSACGVGHGDVQTAIRAVLGVDAADLPNRWRNWAADRT